MNPEAIPWEELIEIAHRQALRAGLGPEDAEDCASEFLIHALRKGARVIRPGVEVEAQDRWLRRCARNFARNYRRSELRRRNGDALFPPEDAAGSTGLSSGPARPTPEGELLLREFWTQLAGALSQIPPASARILICHHLEEVPLAELAAAESRSPQAVAQALDRTRKRIRALLQRRGVEADDLHSYIAGR